MNQYMLAVGGLIEGYSFVGPFATYDEAAKCKAAYYGHQSLPAMIVELHKPE